LSLARPSSEEFHRQFSIDRNRKVDMTCGKDTFMADEVSFDLSQIIELKPFSLQYILPADRFFRIQKTKPFNFQ
jgi:hypothetical protein